MKSELSFNWENSLKNSKKNIAAASLGQVHKALNMKGQNIVF